MSVKTFALIYGIVFLVVGAAGFIPGLLHDDVMAENLTVDAGAGLLFGLFPVNLLHNIVHLAFGVWGLAAARTINGSLLYARSVAVIYAIFVVMGFIPILSTVFGLVPLYGNDIWLHLVLAAVAFYFGFVRGGSTERRAVTG